MVPGINVTPTYMYQIIKSASTPSTCICGRKRLLSVTVLSALSSLIFTLWVTLHFLSHSTWCEGLTCNTSNVRTGLDGGDDICEEKGAQICVLLLMR